MSKEDQVRAAILKAAEALFQRWGIAKTTMEDIARQAGKGKSTLYYYFKSKEDVLETVAVAQINKIMAKVKEEVQRKVTAKDKLLSYFLTTFSEFRQGITLSDIARGDIKADMTLIDGIMKKYNALDEKMLVSILKFGISRGEFKSIGPRDIKNCARTIQTVKQSLTISLFIDNADNRLIDQVIKLMSEGL